MATVEVESAPTTIVGNDPVEVEVKTTPTDAAAKTEEPAAPHEAPAAAEETVARGEADETAPVVEEDVADNVTSTEEETAADNKEETETEAPAAAEETVAAVVVAAEVDQIPPATDDAGEKLQETEVIKTPEVEEEKVVGETAETTPAAEEPVAADATEVPVEKTEE